MDLDSLPQGQVEEVFARHGALAITLTDAGDSPVLEPAPGETPLWPDTRITGLFSSDVDLELLQNDLLRSFNIDTLPSHEMTDLEDCDWEREWRNDLGPLKFGARLWICPGDSTADNDDAIVVRLDPGVAFGTGTHATTALCLEWLDSLALQGSRVLDYGCGSGVLAIAALLLGCETAWALDIDPQAIAATRNNASRNGVADRLLVSGSSEDVAGVFDVVVANILAGPIIRLAEPIAHRVKSGCLLALSGILSEQVDAVLDAYKPWIEFEEPAFRVQGGQTWVRLTGARNKG